MNRMHEINVDEKKKREKNDEKMSSTDVGVSMSSTSNDRNPMICHRISCFFLSFRSLALGRSTRPTSIKCSKSICLVRALIVTHTRMHSLIGSIFHSCRLRLSAMHFHPMLEQRSAATFLSNEFEIQSDKSNHVASSTASSFQFYFPDVVFSLSHLMKMLRSLIELQAKSNRP